MTQKWFPFPGYINESYKKWVRALGISDGCMIEHYADRDREIVNMELPRTRRSKKMKRTKIKAISPILIVGAGPSSKDYDAIRKWDGKIACVDVMFNTLCNNNIKVDYIIILEVGIRPALFEDTYLEQCGGTTSFVFSSNVHGSLPTYAERFNSHFTRWKTHEECRTSNVGLFSVVYAKKCLNHDKIFIIGFEHTGRKYDKREYQRWRYDFWYFIKNWPKETIVNCSQGGALYFKDYIIDANLNHLEIENGD